MNVLVNGASGFVGRHLLPALEKRWKMGYAVSRNCPRSLVTRWPWIARDRVLSKGGGGRARLVVDCVIHLEVKQHLLHASPEDFVEMESVILGGLTEWLRFCSENSVSRFVYLSSIKAVEGDELVATREAEGPVGSTAYGRLKWEAEALVRQWVLAGPGRSALVLRPAVVYGPGNMGNIGAMVSAISRGHFFLIGENRNIKSVVSVGNLVAALVFLLEKMHKGECEIYNIVDATSYTVRELDGMVRQCLGKEGNSPTLPTHVATIAARFGDAIYWFSRRTFPINSGRLRAMTEHTHFSCQKLIEMGFVHPQTTQAGLAEMIRWQVAQP